MKFYSDLTNKFYPSMEAAQKAEDEYNQQLEHDKQVEKEWNAKMKEKQEALEKKYKEYCKVSQEFFTLRDEFYKTYCPKNSYMDDMFEPLVDPLTIWHWFH